MACGQAVFWIEEWQMAHALTRRMWILKHRGQCGLYFHFVRNYKPQLVSGISSPLVIAAKMWEEGTARGVKKTGKKGKENGDGRRWSEHKRNPPPKRRWWMTGLKVNLTASCMFRHPACLVFPRLILISRHSLPSISITYLLRNVIL